MNELNNKDAAIFVSQNFLENTITTFTINNKAFKKSKIKINELMKIA